MMEKKPREGNATIELEDNTHLPLEGLKVLDIATMMAAPWAATYLADFGAEVIKIEHPEFGDHSRRFGRSKNGIPLFWKTIGRNKETVTLKLSVPEGQEIFKELIKECDILIENFRPGTLEKWNIGWDVLTKINPRLIMLRTTGFGQDGPYAKRGGFGTIAEAMSGFAASTGLPDGAPTLPSLPLADGVCSIFGALSVLTAVYERDILGSSKGQFIDICLYEPLMRLMEFQILEYDQLGLVAHRKGNRSDSAAPRNSYLTRDGKWVALSASAQPIAENVFRAIGKEELITDPRFKDNKSRLENVVELDSIVGSWIAEHDMDDVISTFNKSGAIIGPMYDMSQIFQDPHFAFRQSLVKVKDKDFGDVTMPNIVSRFSRTPGKIKHSGRGLGEDNETVYQKYLGFSKEKLAELKSKGVI